MFKEITIVIPCHNRLAELTLSLDALSKQTYPSSAFEVIIVDQASTDGSQKYVFGYQSSFELRIIEQDNVYGISVSRNAGAEAARSPIVLFLDADLIADPHLVESHIECHRRYPGNIICGRVLPYQPAYTSYIDKCADPEIGLDRGEAEGPIPFYQAFGGHASMSNDTYQRIGLYDIRLKRWQDVEYACRAEEIGIGFINCPKAISYHNHSRTLQQRIEYAETSRMIPILSERYPDSIRTIPGVDDYLPLNWRNDGLLNIIKKTRTRIYGLKLTRWLFFNLLNYFNRVEKFPRIVKALYWRLMLGHRYFGFQKGLSLLKSGNYDNYSI